MKKLYEEPVFDVTKVFFEDLLKESFGGDPEGGLGEGGGSGGGGAFGPGE